MDPVRDLTAPASAALLAARSNAIRARRCTRVMCHDYGGVDRSVMCTVELWDARYRSVGGSHVGAEGLFAEQIGVDDRDF